MSLNPAIIAYAVKDQERIDWYKNRTARTAAGTKERVGCQPVVRYADAKALCRRGINLKRLKRKVCRYRASKRAKRRTVWAQEFNILTKEERVARGLPARLPVKKSCVCCS